MLTRTALAAALILSPLVWSMANENTALVKSYAAGVLAAATLLAASWRPRPAGPAWPVHALVTLSLAAACFSPSPSFAWPAAALAATLWLLAAAAARPISPAFWLGTVLAAAALPTALGLLQALDLDPTPWNAVAREHFHGRVCSTLGNPNFLAAFLVGVLPFGAWAGFSSRTRARRVLALGLTGAMFAVLLLTGSKGGMLGIAAGGVLFCFAVRRSRLLALPGGAGLPVRGIAAGLAALAAVTLVAMPSGTRKRLVLAGPEEAATTGAASIVRNESVRFRILTWGQSLRMTREAPLFGHGLGRFQVVYPRFRLPEIIRMFGQHSYMTDHPENLSLEIGAELGIAGLGLWIWLLACAARALAARLDRGPPPGRWLAAACLSALGGLLVTNSFGVDIHYGATAVLGACLLGAALRAPREIPAPAGAATGRPAYRWGAAGAGLILALAWTRIYAADAALARALGRSTAGEWDSAVADYRAAVRLNPGNVMARYFGASALLDRGRDADLPEARRLLDGVRAEAPDYVLLNYKYWLLYNRLRLAREAHDALARQISLDPLAAAFYLERGRLALEEERWEDARTDFETAVRVEPDNPAGFQYLGNLLVLRGRHADALAVYARGLERHPDSPELNYNAAVAAFQSGDMKSARAYARAVLARVPSHPQARLILSKTAP